MNIVIYTKPGCAICLSAKDKLKRMGLKFTEVVGEKSPVQKSVPLLEIDGEEFDYPGAMKRLKEMRGE